MITERDIYITYDIYIYIYKPICVIYRQTPNRLRIAITTAATNLLYIFNAYYIHLAFTHIFHHFILIRHRTVFANRLKQMIDIDNQINQLITRKPAMIYISQIDYAMITRSYNANATRYARERKRELMQEPDHQWQRGSIACAGVNQRSPEANAWNAARRWYAGDQTTVAICASYRALALSDAGLQATHYVPVLPGAKAKRVRAYGLYDRRLQPVVWSDTIHIMRISPYSIITQHIYTTPSTEHMCINAFWYRLRWQMLVTRWQINTDYLCWFITYVLYSMLGYGYDSEKSFNAFNQYIMIYIYV